jgi:hypothetical protein
MQGSGLTASFQPMQWSGVMDRPATAVVPAAAATFTAAPAALGLSGVVQNSLQPAAAVSAAALLVQPGAMMQLQPLMLSGACQQQQQQVLQQQLSEAQLSYSAGVALLPGDLFGDGDDDLAM